MKSLGAAEPATECQKRKYVRQVRWQMQSSQVQNDPDRLAVWCPTLDDVPNPDIHCTNDSAHERWVLP